MGHQADDDNPGPGKMPGPGGSLPELLASFEHGGAWDAAAPSAALAAALEAAAGPDGLYDGAGAGSLVGITRQWTALESWAAAHTMGALRAMTREDAQGRPLTRRRSDLPDGWSDSLNYEIAAALAMGPVSAGNLAALAWALGPRLPGIGRLLARGTLTKAKARLIAQIFEPLTEEEAARAEALILGELAGKTWFQVQRLAWRAAVTIAPDAAERRRAAAEKKRARVTVFREESGAAGLSGRDLPTAPALSAHANVLARAGLLPEHGDAGAFFLCGGAAALGGVGGDGEGGAPGQPLHLEIVLARQVAQDQRLRPGRLALVQRLEGRRDELGLRFGQGAVGQEPADAGQPEAERPGQAREVPRRHRPHRQRAGDLVVQRVVPPLRQVTAAAQQRPALTVLPRHGPQRGERP